MSLVIPPEGTYGDIEHDFIENEPPGLFPTDQNSLWGQARKIFTDELQVVADKMAQWYLNLDPRTVHVDDMPEWEYMLNIPDSTGKTDEARRAFILARRERGPFTRTRRRKIVESFITATFGVPIMFTPTGVPFTAGGIPFFSGEDSLVGTYTIIENIPAYSYEVRVLDSLDIDVVGLQRELDRITPAVYSFTITETPTP